MKLRTSVKMINGIGTSNEKPRNKKTAGMKFRSLVARFTLKKVLT
jgi:hypothetical protein